MITFDGYSLRNYVDKINKIDRPVLASRDHTLVDIPGMAGAIVARSKTGVRTIRVEVQIFGETKAEIRSKVDTLAEVLLTEEPAPLVFDDENHKTYWAIVASDTPFDELAKLGKATILFVCPDPHAKGATKSKTPTNKNLLPSLYKATNGRSDGQYKGTLEINGPYNGLLKNGPNGAGYTFIVPVERNKTYTIANKGTAVIYVYPYGSTTAMKTGTGTFSFGSGENGYLEIMFYEPTGDPEATIIDYQLELSSSQEGIFEPRNGIVVDGGNMATLPKVTATFGDVLKKDDFVGKVSGSTVGNPHIFKWDYNTALTTPTETVWSEGTQPYYDQIEVLDGTVFVMQNATANNISQSMYSFNLIEHVQRKHQITIPGSTTADKVKWLKNHIPKMAVSYHGRGSGPTGPKVSLAVWRSDNSTWYTGASHTNTTISALNYNTLNFTANSTPLIYWLDANGFVHFLAYAEASDGTTASKLDTDFIDIEVTLNVPGTYVQIENDEGQKVKSVYNYASGTKAIIDNADNLVTINGTVNNQTVTLDSDFFTIDKNGHVVVSTDGTLSAITIEYVERWL